jgi:hypothetical protein
MSKDVRDGLAIGVAFAGLVSLFPAHAEAQMSAKELCDGAVNYSIKYMPEEEAFKLHQARWAIMDGDNATDDEKLIGLVMFEIGQRIAYSMNEENNRSNTEWWDKIVESMYKGCNDAYAAANRTPAPLSEMQGSGEIW